MGINETKDVLRVVLKTGNALGVSLVDGKLDLSDAANFVGVLLDIPAALTGIGEVPAELADLDQVEAEELFKMAWDEFDIPQDEVEARVEQALKVAKELFLLIAMFKKAPDA